MTGLHLLCSELGFCSCIFAVVLLKRFLFTSNVLGAYASFLWENTEDDDEGDAEGVDGQSNDFFGTQVRHEIFA